MNMDRKSITSRVGAFAVVAAAAASGYGVALEVQASWDADTSWAEAPDTALVGIGDRTQSDLEDADLLVAFFGAESCTFSTHEIMREPIAAGIGRVRADAESRGLAWATVGVAVDADPHGGLEYLEEFGNFDHLVAGKGWRRFGAGASVLSTLTGSQATPQLVFMERDSGNWRIRLWLRGTESIRTWVAADAAIPPLVPLTEVMRGDA